MLKLGRIEAALPQLLEGWLEWIPWFYSIWQLLRTNPLVIFLLSYLPFRFRKWTQECRKGVEIGNSIVVALEKGEKENTMSSEKAKQYVKNFRPTTLQIWENWLTEVGMEPPNGEWVIIRHNGYYYITTVYAAAQLEICGRTCKGSDNCIFVHEIRAVTDKTAVGEKLSLSEAYEMILMRTHHIQIIKNVSQALHPLALLGLFWGSSEFSDPREPFSEPWALRSDFDLIVPSCIRYCGINTKLWIVLGALPALAQAAGFNRLSMLLSLLILLLDMFRFRIYDVYDWLFWKTTVIAKKHLFKDKSKCYGLFSAFSERWKYSKSDTRKAYELSVNAQKEETETEGDIESGRGSKIEVKKSYMKPRIQTSVEKIHCCKLKHLEDVTILDYGTHDDKIQDAKKPKQCAVRVYDDKKPRAVAEEMRNGYDYASSVFHKTIFVE